MLVYFVKDKICVENNMGLPKSEMHFTSREKEKCVQAALVPKFLQSCHFLASEWLDQGFFPPFPIQKPQSIKRVFVYLFLG